MIVDDINKKAVQAFYEKVDKVWPDNDGWHLINQHEICRYIKKCDYFLDKTILNAGSGGNNYDIPYAMCHLDIVKNKIDKFPNYIVGSVESIPCMDSQFDIVICVGSVLNYCDAVCAVSEMARVLNPGGKLILEFESSYSFEYIGSKAYKQPAAIVNTMYFNKPHQMWAYSAKYISDLLRLNSLTIDDKYGFHILSGLAYKFSKNENSASKFARFDRALRHMPIIKNYAANVIFTATKS